ncbi:hypothetical protein chiPu_0023413 [Chiloscyllium punctatum]|uniref:Uncharacterized protein n=1 Tax=Chiloscyllium punctatum TaxID=137246 RepID=A0A401TB35_CHIPU|nr:hypothetical protein [Chiloscyllium punctatum]
MAAAAHPPGRGMPPPKMAAAAAHPPGRGMPPYKDGDRHLRHPPPPASAGKPPVSGSPHKRRRIPRCLPHSREASAEPFVRFARSVAPVTCRCIL